MYAVISMCLELKAMGYTDDRIKDGSITQTSVIVKC